jgi:L1 cell adhesion molecule like protein
MTRAKFNNICEDLFKSTLEPVEKVLKDSKFAKNDIHDIVLVGGTTRIPKIQEILSTFFNEIFLSY